MTQSILYIQGSACPHDSATIQYEIGEQKASLDALRSPVSITRNVGNPIKGFALRGVEEAFQELPTTPTVIINAHGNVDFGRHFVQATEKSSPTGGRIFADKLYGELAKYAYGSSLDVFMISCGSGSSCDTAADKLPAGSTVVNFTTSDVVCSYGLKSDGFNVPATESSNYGEDLFLSILCKGFADKFYQPQITTCGGNKSNSRTWNMWDLAQKECLANRGRSGYDDILPTLKKELGRFTTSEQIEKAFLFMAPTSSTSSDGTIPSASTSLRIKPEALLEEAIKQNLLGVICAIAYVRNRELIGAFQASAHHPSANSAPEIQPQSLII